jgi:polyferredoxin
MLRKLRIALALVAFAVLTFFFLDFSRLLPESAQVIAKIQFVPALISLSLGIVLLLLLLTLVFGRIYCSVICPLGIYQDVISRLANLFRKKKLRYKFRKARTILRWSVLTLVIITYLSGLGLVLDLLDPYSMYGRMAVHLFKPVYMAANNGLELLFTAFNNYTFYKVDIHFWGWASFGLALISLLVVSVLAWRFGRTWCNTICPVGTVLGFLSKFSVFKLSIDHETCNQCGLCSFNCKATCIDSKKGSIDYSRCVACFNCMESCNKKGVKYLPFWKVKKNRDRQNSGKNSKRQNSGKNQNKNKKKN